ncbi:MAG: glycosyltransferase family 4 protein [Rhizonema sp. PD37]|nr:glycosyltransferase family 4 protein [Rhizonema sp. PD37]
MNVPKQKLRLLTIFPSNQRGGTEEYALKIATAAVEQGWEVHVAFPKRETTASLVQSFEEKGVIYHPFEIPEIDTPEFKTLKTYVVYLTRTIGLLLKNKPNVVHVNLPWFKYCFASIIACGLLKVPTAVIFHLIPEYVAFNSKKLRVYAWARSRGQQWIGVSEHNRKVVSETFQIPQDQVLCIYNGSKVVSNASNFTQEEITTVRHQLRQELSLPAKSRLALTVGRLSVQKGHTDLIRAIPPLVKEFPDMRFIWVGEGEERENLVNKVREYGIEDKVLFLGYRSDVPKLLVAADLFIFPTQFEGQPFAIIEAMAYGLPIVTSNACGIPELIEDKVHGLLFRKGDSCELLEATSWALRHPEQMQEMAKRAKLRVQEFSEEKMVKKTLSALHKLTHALPEI